MNLYSMLCNCCLKYNLIVIEGVMWRCTELFQIDRVQETAASFRVRFGCVKHLFSKHLNEKYNKI